MPNVTVDTVQSRTDDSFNEDHEFKEQVDADNKFLEIAEDYDNRDGYVKTVDLATKKVYTYLDFTITVLNV